MASPLPSFYEVRVLAPRPNPNLTSQGISLCPARPSKRVRHGGGILPGWRNKPLAISVPTIHGNARMYEHASSKMFEHEFFLNAIQYTVLKYLARRQVILWLE
jgi:hypothetical protein